MIQILPTLANLQASFHGKNSFSHIQCLHNMLDAYGATVIEIVRQKEFGGWFIDLSATSAILTILLA
jgi:autophagy-related protein 11